MYSLIKLIAIVGPTAVGKTGVAIEIAKRINGEIISCDSMQVYRGMDIGTAKATKLQREQVVHHLVDVADIDENYNVARYQKEARLAIEDVSLRGKTPILVGGTGLYYQALVDDYHFNPMESKENVRDKWNTEAKVHGLSYVYNYLVSIDPDYARRIAATDQKRIIRAIEVYELTGMPFSQHQIKNTGFYNLAVIGLDMARAELYQRIDNRVNNMLADGWIDEVKGLINQGDNQKKNALQALGYQQIIWYLHGLLSYSEMAREIKRETRHYAKRQLTWFRRDKRIYWISIEKEDNKDNIVEKIFTYLEGQFPGA